MCREERRQQAAPGTRHGPGTRPVPVLVVRGWGRASPRAGAPRLSRAPPERAQDLDFCCWMGPVAGTGGVTGLAGIAERGTPVLQLLAPQHGAAAGAVCSRPQQMLPRRVNMCLSHIDDRLDLKIAKPGEPTASLITTNTSCFVSPNSSVVSLQELDPAAPSLVKDPLLSLCPSSPQMQRQDPSHLSSPVCKGRVSTCTRPRVIVQPGGRSWACRVTRSASDTAFRMKGILLRVPVPLG